MTEAVNFGKEKTIEGWAAKSKYLIGEPAETAGNAPPPASTHPSNIHAPLDKPDARPVSVFDAVDVNSVTELQWATITLLAIDVDVRGHVARQTPPAPAAYLRALDDTYAQWVLGDETCGISTSIEATLEFVNAVEVLYKFNPRT